MNKQATPTTLWTVPEANDPPAPGYDAWLERELARGQADLDAGKSTPRADVRKEFGLE